jgi:hypothetical protein
LKGETKTIVENSVLEYLMFSVHVILYCTVHPGLYLGSNSPVKNWKELSVTNKMSA